MKRTVLIIAILLLIGSGVFVFGAEGRIKTVPLADIPEAGGLSDAVPGGNDDSLLLELSYEGVLLPVNEDGTVLIPVIPETGLTVTAAKGASLSKSQSVSARESGAYRSLAITAESGGRSRTLTLTETGMAVARLDLNVTGVTKGSDPILDKKREGALYLFSLDENGGLRFESGRVSAKLRGGSSRGYRKKSYTLTNLDETGSRTVRSLLGLPADVKYGLNSMYEDDVKLRDVLSLETWENMLPAGSYAIRMRYCELYIDGVYWGLYGFQQIVSPYALGIGPDDGLLKIVMDFAPSVLSGHRKYVTDVKQELSDGDVAYLFLDALARLADGEADAPGLFDRDTLFRYALFLQFICGTDSSFKNLTAVCHADTGLFSFLAYDTDQSFGLAWDNGRPPLYMGVHPELAGRDFLKERRLPWAGLLSVGESVTKPLAELWFSLREDALSEEALLGLTRELFTLVTDSGARKRERIRWPGGNYADSPAQVEAFITERLAWCDDYFGRFLPDRAAG